MHFVVTIFQQEVIPANPEANAQKIINAVRDTLNREDDRTELFICPEMAIPGYLLGDLPWESPDFLRRCAEAEDLIRETFQHNDIAIIFGNVVSDYINVNEDGRVRKYNAAVMVHKGTTQYVYKTLMPNYREFDDSRYFYHIRNDAIVAPNNPLRCLNYQGVKLGVMLCEDGWDGDYSIKVARHLHADGAQLFINISCSPYTIGKAQKRNRVFAEHAYNFKTPFIYVNNVGIQNNNKNVFAFDGDSCVYDCNGKSWPIAFRLFEETLHTLEVYDGLEFNNNYALVVDTTGYAQLDAIVYMFEKFLEQCGQNKVVIGASGGVDSALVAGIAALVLPPENILLVNMPTKYNSEETKNAAEELANNIGCKYIVHPIQESVDRTFEEVSIDGKKLTPYMMENVQARDRSARVLSAYAALFGGVFTCNSNKSETTVGYATIGGDIMGWAAPIADIYKENGPFGCSVYKMCEMINDRWKENNDGRQLIPDSILQMKPSAELSEEQKVHGDPFVYKYHDRLFASWVEYWNRANPETILEKYLLGSLESYLGYNGQIVKSASNPNDYVFENAGEFIADLEKWWNLFTGLSVAKRCLTPPTFVVSRRAFGFDNREAQLQWAYSDRYNTLKEKIINEQRK